MQTLSEEEKARLLSYLPQSVKEGEMLESWIVGSLLSVSREYFGDSFIYALSLYVAHKGSLASRGAGGEGGAVASIREGDISVSYSSSSGSGDDSYLNSTSYGQEYLRLLKQYSRKPFLTGGFCLGGPGRGNFA